MERKLAILFALIAISVTTVHAQQSSLYSNDSLSPKLLEIAKPESKPNWIKFKEGISITPTTVFTKYKDAFNLRDNDKMALFKTEKDNLGFTHYRYQQYYKNIKVEGATYIVHANKSGATYAANGNMLTGIDVSTAPAISSKQAIDLALKSINAKEYMWQSKVWESDLKRRTGKADTSFYPKPELVIRQIKNQHVQTSILAKQFYLVYKMDIYSSSPNNAQRVFIDANTGKVLETLPLQASDRF